MDYNDDPLIAFRNKQVRTTVNTQDIWHSTFAGVPAIQAWQDFMLWEEFLNGNKPEVLWEIGTFLGGFSIYLSTQCNLRNIGFSTFDFQKYYRSDDVAHINSGTDDEFEHMDVFDDKFTNMLQRTLLAPDTTPFMLFCDGGNKPKEMQTFSKMLRPGDLMAVHDFTHEIGEEDLIGLPIEMLMREECEQLQSLTRFFKVL